MTEVSDWKTTYDSMRATYDALAEEIAFILNGVIPQAQIKIHGIETRVKEKGSIELKCIAKNIDYPLAELHDIVGARVICLFRDDLTKIGALIDEYFDVIETDDKVNTTSETFGYMSVHYICRINQRYEGYRYEKLKTLRFEIQVRTLCMHAWAVVSHYLDYKGDWDVPADLRRSLNSLSALFYVADTEFESISHVRIASQQKAIEQAQRKQHQEINLDTVTAYLAVRFPARAVATQSDISEFVKELKDAGYSTIEEMATDIDRADAAVLAYEQEHRPGPSGEFAAVGAARISLGIASQRFRGLKYSAFPPWDKYEALLK